MVIKHIKYMGILALLMFAQFALAQEHLLSEVKINRSSVYVGEPARVSVSVFTSTWFTSGINPGNIKVNGAFTVFFRSVSQSKKIDGKTYAGVEMIFNVFPYDDDDLVFPALEFEVETPDEGGYKAVKRKVKTREQKINVKPIPKAYQKDLWLVATGMSVDDSWTGDLTNVKVGDVLERTISRKVSGTVSELVPPIVWDTLPGVSLYPTRAEVSSEKTKTSISATRKDGMRYLFEHEGTITIPAFAISWWNPEENKLYKRTLKAITIEVQPNPDLGMLESLRDSLALTQIPVDDATGNSSSTGLFGLSLKQWIFLSLILIIVIYLLYRFFKWVFITKGLIAHFKKRRQLYLESEAYYFKLFKSAATKRDSTAILQSIYRWIDKLQLKEPTMQFFVTTYGCDDLNRELETISSFIGKGENIHGNLTIKNWEKARNNYLSSLAKGLLNSSHNWINP